LQRSLQRANLPLLLDRYTDSEAVDECKYTLPPVISWCDLDPDHVISSGQVFKREEASHERLWQLRKLGLQVLRQGKVGVVLLAGGANHRLLSGHPPVSCNARTLQLCSGKSLIQILCERIRRIASLAKGPEDSKATPPGQLLPRPAVPVFVMTSRLTHRSVVEHFESRNYFGLSSRDVVFFEQPVQPVLSEDGRLLPQSLGGEFAHAPTGTGVLLKALKESSALDQIKDRGVECLHILGTDNLLARACDPFFLGFCRELDVDCACKVVERLRPEEDLDLFCVRQSPVTTQFADIEEAACALAVSEASPEVLHDRVPPSGSSAGALRYPGLLHSYYFTVTYIEEVLTRPIRLHRLARVVPFLDFHMALPPSLDADVVMIDSPPPNDPVPQDKAPISGQILTAQPLLGPKFGKKAVLPSAPLALYSWPQETLASDLPMQRALRTAAAEVRGSAKGDSVMDGEEEAWRCEVELNANDSQNPIAVVKVRSAERGSLYVPRSLRLLGNVQAERANLGVRCSLVVPTQPNAVALETFLSDYFVYTDRAVAFEVARFTELALVCEDTGLFSPDNARASMSSLHRGWLVAAGCRLEESKPGSIVEVSPLLSYEGEGGFGDVIEALALTGVCQDGQQAFVLDLPCHLPSVEESSAHQQEIAPAPDETCVDPEVNQEFSDGLDTRNFYLQEYAHTLKISNTQATQFRSVSREVAKPKSQPNPQPPPQPQPNYSRPPQLQVPQQQASAVNKASLLAAKGRPLAGAGIGAVTKRPHGVSNGRSPSGVAPVPPPQELDA
jgi:UDP-N-acetylglucosamine pyrophosphorylase